MADYSREKTVTSELYLHRLLSGGQQSYTKLPYNLVRLDDGTEYIEPVNTLVLSPRTWIEDHPPSASVTPMYIDLPPGSGVTEIG